MYLLLLSFFFSLVFAGFPPTPTGITTVQVKGHAGVSISYKKTCVCDTTVNAYAGYVHMPPSYTGEIYNISLFFWYFEARNDPQNAPTTIYLAGGPGESSSWSAVSEGGPCTVLDDSKTTQQNPWSLNMYSNVLYLDQPVGTGFSYNSLFKSTMDWLFVNDGTSLTTGVRAFEDYHGDVPPENVTFTYGVLPSQDPSQAPNSTATAAKTIWQFSQIWFSNFPERSEDQRINLWGNSAGGLWCSISGAYFLEQNSKIAKGEVQGMHLNLDTVGFTDGEVDTLYQSESWPGYAYNNTYGLQVIPEDFYHQALHNFTKPDGCRDLITRCRSLGDKLDPSNSNTNEHVNKACVEAIAYCLTYVAGAYDALSNRSDFDMAHLKPDPGPPSSNGIGYMNTAEMQQELGVPVNLTADSQLITNNFEAITGDTARVAGLKALEAMLDAGVKVALVNGDRDYRVTWTGTEKMSLAVDWAGKEEFKKGGYEFVRTNATYNGGVVRQHGNFSFTRVFQSGHGAASYQPETVINIFNRLIANKDIATGSVSTLTNYSTTGPQSSFYMVEEKLPPPPPFKCYIYNIQNVGSTCTVEQYEALKKGTAVVEDLYVVKPAGGSPGALP